MALVFMDGFDAYNTVLGNNVDVQILRKWHQCDFANPNPTTQAGRISGFSLYPGNTNVYTLPFASQSSYIVGTAIFVNAYNIPLLRFMDGTSFQCTLGLDSLGRLQIWNGSGGAVQATGTTILATSTWYFIEMIVTFNSTTGAFHLKLNNNDEIVATNINTVTTANNTGNRFALWAAGPVLWDDFRIFDTTGTFNNDFIGDMKIETLFASGPGVYTQFAPTPNTNANWQNVSEIAVDDDVTYNSATTAGNQDAYTFHPLSVILSNVHGVGVNIVQRKDNPASKTATQLTHIGGSDFLGNTTSTLDSYYTNEKLYDVNPATSLPWTVTDLTNAQFGIRVIS
jgi:hypothetical protein